MSYLSPSPNFSAAQMTPNISKIQPMLSISTDRRQMRCVCCWKPNNTYDSNYGVLGSLVIGLGKNYWEVDPGGI